MKTTFEDRFKNEGLLAGAGWDLSSMSCDIFIFGLEEYVQFLDQVETKEDLVKGLSELSPFADDALDVAAGLSDGDFEVFKVSLKNERQLSQSEGGRSTLQREHRVLVLPRLFVEAYPLASRAEVPLGTALIRLALEKRNA